MADNDAIGKLEEAALKRRERLKALSNRQQNESSSNGYSDSKDSLPKPVFRSYQPQDETLRENSLPKTKPESVENQVKSHLEAEKPEPLINEVDLATLAPRKPDWDLKRDVSKKLEKLERRTQRAIAELIRERLKSGFENLAEVTASATAGQNIDSDEEQ